MRILALVFLLGLTAAAWAEVESLQVAAVGYYNEWWAEPWAGHVAAVLLPNDSNDTRIYFGTDSARESYTLTNSIPAGATIDSVFIYTNIWEEYDNTRVQGFLRLGTAEEYAPSDNCTSTWTPHTHKVDRPGGGSYSRSDFNTIQVGVMVDNWDEGGTPRVTTLLVIVHYTPGTGGSDNSFFAFSAGGG